MATGGAKDDLYTFDLTVLQGGPRVPDEADLGGSQMADVDPVPKQGEEPFAGLFNEQVRNLAGLNRIGPRARVTVKFIAGVPTVTRVVAMGRVVGVGSFTALLPATGHVTIGWAPGTLPPQEEDPDVRMRGDGTGYGQSNGVDANMVDVFLKTNNVAANVDFAVEIH